MCEKQGIMGKNITPFVLSEVSRLTKGLSMDTSKILENMQFDQAVHIFYLFILNYYCFQTFLY